MEAIRLSMTYFCTAIFRGIFVAVPASGQQIQRPLVTIMNQVLTFNGTIPNNYTPGINSSTSSPVVSGSCPQLLVRLPLITLMGLLLTCSSAIAQNLTSSESHAISAPSNIGEPINPEVFNPFNGIRGPRALLIIAPKAFISAAQPLVDHKNAIGMSATAVAISAITNYFPGRDDPERIKRGIQYAHEQLGTQYVMLVGDASYFPVRYLFWWHLDNGLPYTGSYIASDLYYANLYHHGSGLDPLYPVSFDNWDANGNRLYNEGTWDLNPIPNPDGVDGLPDIAIGRVPAHSAADVTTYVNKLITYENLAATYAPRSFTFVADAGYPYSVSLSNYIATTSHLGAPARFRLISDKPQPVSAPWINEVLAQNLPILADQIAGSEWVSYLGHGTTQSWDAGSNGNYVGPAGLDPTFMGLLNFNFTPPVVFAAGCSTGMFAPAPPHDTTVYRDVNQRLWNFFFNPKAQAKGDGLSTDPTTYGLNSHDWVVFDQVTDESWGGCLGCHPLPLAVPEPDPYARDDGPDKWGFAYSWLIKAAEGGAIAYFGETGIAEDKSGAELETYMLAQYQKGDRILGSIHLKGELQYWGNHLADTGADDLSKCPIIVDGASGCQGMSPSRCCAVASQAKYFRVNTKEVLGPE